MHVESINDVLVVTNCLNNACHTLVSVQMYLITNYVEIN